MLKSMMFCLLAGIPDLNKAIKGFVTHFNNENEDHDIRQPTSAFKRLVKKLLQGGSYEDCPRTGRPPNITEDQVRHCVSSFKKGVNTGRKDWYGFTGIEHAAVECPEIKAVLDETKVTVDTLWGRMKDLQLKEHGHGFRKITIRVKPKLSAEVKEERQKKAEEWSRMSLKDLMCVFWIDEKQEYMLDKSYTCYAGDDAASFSVESNTPLGKAKKLKYIACVNAVLGPVYVALISGTSAFDSGFAVRTHVPSLRYKHTAMATSPPSPC